MTAGGGVGDASTANDVVQFAITPRPRSLLYALMGVIVVESAAVHALIYKRWPLASVVLLVLNVWTQWWLWREFSAGGHVTVRPDSIEVRSGRSIRIVAPRSSVRSVRRPEWRELAAAGTKGYLRIAGGDDPNVLVEFEPGVEARLAFGVKRPVALIGVHLGEAGAIVALFGDSSGATSAIAPGQFDVHK